MAKNPHASAGDACWIPGGEDPLKEETAACASIHAGIIPRTEEPGGLQSMSHKESDKTKASKHTYNMQSASNQVRALQREVQQDCRDPFQPRNV